MCLWFGIAHIKKNNGLVDIAWGLGFVIVTLVLLSTFWSESLRQMLITGMIFLWGIRLSGYLLLRNWGKPEDWRYANWRKDWTEKGIYYPRTFFQIFMLQGSIMFLILLPVIRTDAFENVNSNNLIWSDFIAILFFLIGFCFEAIGDYQLYKFKSDPSNKGKLMTAGLWRYTRHPNYFGEALLWWGIFILSIPAGNILLSLISPILITFLLLKVSGVVMLEKKLNLKPDFVEYKRRTNAFLPWFPRE